jgi:hypothetical protein
VIGGKSMGRINRLINKAIKNEAVDFKRIPLAKVAKVIEDMGFVFNENESDSAFGFSEINLVFEKDNERFEIYVELGSFDCTLTYFLV